jgi:hypothetical protein
MSRIERTASASKLNRLHAENAMLHRIAAKLMADIVRLVRLQGLPVSLPDAWSVPLKDEPSRDQVSLNDSSLGSRAARRRRGHRRSSH